MAHEFESGFFANGEAAWHRLGFVYPVGQRPASALEALIKAGCDWLVGVQPVYIGGSKELNGWKALYRISDGTIYNVVSDRYVPLQNADMANFLDPFVRNGQIMMESGGSLRDGAHVWMLAEITTTSMERMVKGKDPIKRYLLITLGHDGIQAVVVKFTDVRVVCMNTLNGALNAAGDSISIVHSARAKEKLKALQSMIDIAGRRFDIAMSEYEAMAGVQINGEQFKAYVRRVLQPRKVAQEEAKAAALEAEGQSVVSDLLGSLAARGSEDERRAVAGELIASGIQRELQLVQLPASDGMPRAWPLIERAFENGPGHDMAGSTAWGAYNSVTYWLDHERGKEGGDRLYSTWYGSGASIRERAHSEALALVK
jgi:phage/plasmid-like protein (TIGR03299 family)